MVFSGVVVSGAGVGSVSVGSGCVAAGAVSEGSGAVVALSAGVLLGVVGVVGFVGVVGVVGAVAEGSGAVVALSAGVLLGVVGVVGVVGAGSVDGSVVTVLSGVWVLLCCEPVTVFLPSFVIEFALSLTAQLPHLGVRVISVPAAAFTVKVNSEVPFTDICSV